MAIHKSRMVTWRNQALKTGEIRISSPSEFSHSKQASWQLLFRVPVLKHLDARFIQSQPLSELQNHHGPILQLVLRFLNFCNGIQVNHQPDATIFQFIILTFIYSSTCFERSPAHHQELNYCSSRVWFYLHIVVIAVHHDTKVKSEAATAVIEFLMMGGRMPETCWAVNKRQDNKLENCCIWLVIYLKSLLQFLQSLNTAGSK